MDIVESCYIEPLSKLEKSNKLPITVENMKKIFSNFTGLMQAHGNFLHDLHVLNMNWPYIENLGKFFKNFLENVTDLYDVYSKNYSYSKDTLFLCSKESDKFLSYLNDVQNVTQTRGLTEMDLRSLLVIPLTRVQQYNFLLQDICMNTPKDHPDYENLIATKNIIRSLRKLTTDNVNDHQIYSRSLLIEQRLINLDVNFFFIFLFFYFYLFLFVLFVFLFLFFIYFLFLFFLFFYFIFNRKLNF